MLEAPTELVGGRSYNVGIQMGILQSEIWLKAAQRTVPGSELTFTGEMERMLGRTQVFLSHGS